MINSFTFDGVNSRNFGMYISSKKIYDAPEADVEFIPVPGRSGDVLMDNHRYMNTSVSYTVGLNDVKDKIRDIKFWLCKSGYYRLFDSYNPDYYRLACFSSTLDLYETLENVGEAQLVFNCKPYMYSFEGETPITITASSTIYNNEHYSCLPIIEVWGNAGTTIRINGRSYNIKSGYSDLVIDSELMAVYSNNTLYNSLANFTSFPYLDPGRNYITVTGCDRIVITPRFRTL